MIKNDELHIYKLGRNGQQCSAIEKERTMKGYVMMYTLGETSLGFGLKVMIRGILWKNIHVEIWLCIIDGFVIKFKCD
jgi:hypothetical protein